MTDRPWEPKGLTYCAIVGGACLLAALLVFVTAILAGLLCRFGTLCCC